jgi:hypothetical protein
MVDMLACEAWTTANKQHQQQLCAAAAAAAAAAASSSSSSSGSMRIASINFDACSRGLL